MFKTWSVLILRYVSLRCGQRSEESGDSRVSGEFLALDESHHSQHERSVNFKDIHTTHTRQVSFLSYSSNDPIWAWKESSHVIKVPLSPLAAALIVCLTFMSSTTLSYWWEDVMFCRSRREQEFETCETLQ